MEEKRSYTSHEPRKADGWQTLEAIMRQLHTSILKTQGYCHTLKADSQQGGKPMLGDDQRRDLHQRAEQELRRVLELVNTTLSLCEHATKPTPLPRSNDVAVNKLCHTLAHEEDIPVTVGTDLPDDYTVRTDGEVLRAVIKRLLNQACHRVWLLQHGYNGTERVSLCVTRRGEAGQLTFAVTDNGHTPADDERVRLFTLPGQEPPRADTEPLPWYVPTRTVAESEALALPTVAEQIELCLCRAQVHLLGGNIWTDPYHQQGRRIIFNIPSGL